jgi:hypothetical protein
MFSGETLAAPKVPGDLPCNWQSADSDRCQWLKGDTPETNGGLGSQAGDEARCLYRDTPAPCILTNSGETGLVIPDSLVGACHGHTTKQLQTGEYPKATQQPTAFRAQALGMAT